jgi:hypothetical protein
MRRRDVNPSVEKVSTLKIDKDCFVDRDWIENYIHVVLIPVCRSFEVTVNSIRMCNSRRRGLHFYIEISPPIDDDSANRLQWLLGDDSRRVDFNRARIESELDEWNKLFEVPGRRLRTIYRCDKAASNS